MFLKTTEVAGVFPNERGFGLGEEILPGETGVGLFRESSLGFSFFSTRGTSSCLETGEAGETAEASLAQLGNGSLSGEENVHAVRHAHARVQTPCWLLPLPRLVLDGPDVRKVSVDLRPKLSIVSRIFAYQIRAVRNGHRLLP